MIRALQEEKASAWTRGVPAWRILLVVYLALIAGAYVIRDHDLLRHVFWGLALAAVVLVLRADDLRAPLRSPVGCAALLYLGWFGLSALWSEPGSVGLVEVAMSGLGIAAFLLLTIALAQRDHDLARRVMLTMVWVGAAAGLTAMLWFYARHDFPSERVEDFGIGGYFTRAGTMYGIAAVGAWWLLEGERRSPVRRALLAACLAVLLAFVALAQARGAMLGLGLAGLVWAVVTRQRVLLALGAAALVAILAAQHAGLLGAYDLLSRGFTLRLHTWNDALARMPDALWLGYGVGDPQTFVLKHGEAVIHPHTILHPHNAFFGHQLQGGLIGTALFLGVLAAAARAGWRAWRARGDFLMLTLIAFLIGNGLVDFGHFYGPLDLEWFLFWLPVALAAASEIGLREQAPGRAACASPS